MNDIPPEIPEADRQWAFFMQVRRQWDSFGLARPWLRINIDTVHYIKAFLINGSVKYLGLIVAKKTDGDLAIDARDFVSNTYDKFLAIRALPLPIADEIWTHFDPMYV